MLTKSASLKVEAGTGIFLKFLRVYKNASLFKMSAESSSGLQCVQESPVGLVKLGVPIQLVGG